MPSTGRRSDATSPRFLAFGCAPRATSLLRAGVKDAVIVDTLNAEYEDALNAVNALPFTTRDLKDFKEHVDRLDAEQVRAYVRGDASEKKVLARLHRHIEDLLDNVDRHNRMLDTLHDDLLSAQATWREQGKDPSTYPTKPLREMRLWLDTARKVVKDLRNDDRIARFVEQAQFDESDHGYSQAEVLDYLMTVADLLGVDRKDVLRAFEEAVDQGRITQEGPSVVAPP